MLMPPNASATPSSSVPGSSATPLAGLNVLLIAMYYAPESTGSAPYTTDVAEHLAAMGADVKVITAPPHYPDWKRWTRYRNRWTTEVMNGVEVHRAPVYVPADPTLSKRSMYELSFLSSAALPAVSSRLDVVVGTSPSLFGGALARVISKVRRAPLVQLVQDVVSAAPGQTGQSADDGLAAGTLAKIEGAALRPAGAVTIPTDAFRPALCNLGVPANRIHTIPNWSRLTPRETNRPSDRERLGWADRFVVLHTGNVGAKQALHRLAPAIDYIGKQEPAVSFCFLGAGNQLGALRKAMDGLPNVEIRNPVADADYFATLAASDVLLVHEAPSVRNVSLPSKMTAYFAAGRPVLAVTQEEGATAEELRRSRAGMIVPHDEGPLLHAGIQQLMGAPETRTALGDNGQAYWQEHLAPARGLTRVQELVGATAAGAPTLG